ncbi:hypothetical protein M2140_000147 [Clostridiales Family XIII bacterium PM5-7]
MSTDKAYDIIQYKRSVMNSIINEDIIVKAINGKDSNGVPYEPGDLYYTHIFPYAYIPGTIDVAGCYITLEMNIPQVSTANHFFKDLLISVTVICHQDIMQMCEGEPLGATGATRADFVAAEVDKLLNNSVGIVGTKELERVSNIEGAIDPAHRCRIIRYRTSVPAKSLCD